MPIRLNGNATATTAKRVYILLEPNRGANAGPPG